MLRELGWLTQRVQMLSDGQERLAGGLSHVSETQAVSQTAMLQLMEQRLAEVQRAMGDSLTAPATRTARIAWATCTSGWKPSTRRRPISRSCPATCCRLQDILSNKQTRGAFGEIQLHDIVLKALPPDAYTMQATLSNGRRADCLVHLPNPPGPIVIDAKFPLEAYEALRRADSPAGACRRRNAGSAPRCAPISGRLRTATSWRAKRRTGR